MDGPDEIDKLGGLDSLEELPEGRSWTDWIWADRTHLTRWMNY